MRISNDYIQALCKVIEQLPQQERMLDHLAMLDIRDARQSNAERGAAHGANQLAPFFVGLAR